MENKKVSPFGYALAIVSWASVFALAWLLVFDAVKWWPAGGFLAFFFCIGAVVSMAIWSPASKKHSDDG